LYEAEVNQADRVLLNDIVVLEDELQMVCGPNDRI